MYQKKHEGEVFLSNVLLSFSLLLLGCFLLYRRLYEDPIYDYDTYLYFVLTGIASIYFIVSIIQLFLSFYGENLDVELDFKEEEIRLKNRKITYSFQDILLFGYNEKKKESRILIHNKLFGFQDILFTNKQGEKLPEELSKTIGKYAIKVPHSKLYNHTLSIGIGLLILQYVYSFIEDGIEIFGERIPSFTVFSFLLLLFVIINWIFYFRFEKLLKNNKRIDENESISED